MDESQLILPPGVAQQVPAVEVGGPGPDETQPRDAEVVDAELAEAVEDATSVEVFTPEAGDEQAGFVAMDAHDAARFVKRIVEQAQLANLGKRWIYALPGAGGRGLTVDAVEDIVQQMNWSGRCRIKILPATLEVEVIEADEGDGPEPFWVATVAAEDELTGLTLVGTSMEPQKMKLKADTANRKRRELKPIPEDNKVFDRFSRTKAIGKAQRNALESHIPEIVKITLIAMAAKRPELIERIETPAEAKLSELPPPLNNEEAKALIAELGRIYDGIRELGGGKGRVLLPPGQYNAYLVQSQHSMELLGRMKDWLEQRREEIEAEVTEDAQHPGGPGARRQAVRPARAQPKPD